MKTSFAKCTALPEQNTEIYYFPNLRQPFPPHFHDAAVFGCLLKGCREEEHSGSRRILKAGECAFFPAGAIHACKPVANETSAWICMHVRNEFPNIRSPLLFADRKLGVLFTSLATVDHSKLAPLVGELLHFLVSLPDAKRQVVKSTGLVNCMARISNHYSEKIQLAELAEAENLNRYSLLRAFRSSAGITPYRYLEAIRITCSQRWLRNGANLTDCALKAGFYDQSHFNRCFKERLGITPGSYRAAYPIA